MAHDDLAIDYKYAPHEYILRLLEHLDYPFSKNVAGVCLGYHLE